MSKIRKFSPFNVYDFYGYLFPGAILTLFTFFFVVWFTPISFRNIMSLLEEAEKLHIVLGIVGGSGFVAVVYFAGHVNGTLSHLIFDQAFMKRVIGYPVYTLLGLKHGFCSFSRAFYFYLLLFGNVLILLPLVKMLFPDFAGFPIVYGTVLVLLFGLLALGTIVGIMGGPKKILEPNSHKRGHYSFIKRAVRGITKMINWFFCSGISMSHRFFLPLMQMLTGSDRVSDGVVQKFKANIKKLSGLPSEEIGSDNFWLPYIYMHRHEPEIEEHLSNWMNLYAFLKNLSFVAFLLCFEISVAITIHYCNVAELYHVTDTIDVQIVVAGFLFLYISGWILAFRYWTIYKNYFTKYLIRSFSSLTIKSDDTEYEEIIETEDVEITAPFVSKQIPPAVRRRRRTGSGV